MIARVPPISRGPVEPVDVGTVVVKAFRVLGYVQDCDGCLIAHLENIDADGARTGWEVKAIDLSPDSTWVLDELGDLDAAADAAGAGRQEAAAAIAATAEHLGVMSALAAARRLAETGR